ncbi:hypothetical protein AB3Y40_12135 [Yoonia sp. R2331]|uniref:hypothetical protein n=1 Tax=Yoonia sp. R2331 TaxID=3237238 RepID=UPI0034E5E01A
MTKTAETAKQNGKSDSAAAFAAQANEAVEKGVAAAHDTATQVAEHASDELRKVTDASTKFVRENPGTAIAGAVGIGVLLGLALRGRD